MWATLIAQISKALEGYRVPDGLAVPPGTLIVKAK